MQFVTLGRITRYPNLTMEARCWKTRRIGPCTMQHQTRTRLCWPAPFTIGDAPQNLRDSWKLWEQIHRGGAIRGPFFDKIITFVNAAGLPQSYMAFSSMAISMMLDFKCIINPYTVYVDNSAWTGETLSEKATARMRKSAQVMAELMQCLERRNYHSCMANLEVMSPEAIMLC